MVPEASSQDADRRQMRLRTGQGRAGRDMEVAYYCDRLNISVDDKGSSHCFAPLLCHHRTVRGSVGRRCLLRKLFLENRHTPPTLYSILLHSFT